MTPDLASYDVIEISSSAGKDSQAMGWHVAGLLRAAGLLDRGVVVHADLGRVEWPGTPELAEAQARHFGLRFVKVKRPQGDLLARAVADVILHGNKAPRMCSSCGSTEGHRRGDKACPNYATPARWTGERKVWKP